MSDSGQRSGGWHFVTIEELESGLKYIGVERVMDTNGEEVVKRG